MLDLAKTLCHLASIGHPVDLNKWEDPVSEPKKQMMSIPLSGANYRKPEVPDGEQKTPKNNEEMHKKLDLNVNNAQNQSMQTDPLIGNPSPMNQKKQQPECVFDALKIVQEGLKSMQALQMQTAQAHQKFLETQAEAGRILQGMMEKTRQLVKTSIGTETELDVPEGLSDHKVQNVETTTQSQVTTQENIFASATVETPIAAPVPKPAVKPDSADVASPNTAHSEIEQILLEVVSRLTGYPQEMLALDMDIEADLGIDSIKRVEILSTLEEKIPDLPSIPPDILGTLKTLGKIIEYLAETKPLEAKPYQTAEDTPTLSYNESLRISGELQKGVPESIPEKRKKKIVLPVAMPFQQGKQTSLPLQKKL